MSGLIPPEVLTTLQTEYAAQFNDTVTWYRANRDTNGQPVTDRYGNPQYGTTATLPARVVEHKEQLYDAQGRQVISAEYIYLPLTYGVGGDLTPVDVLPGDKLVRPDQDATKPPPVLSVTYVPDRANAVYLAATTGRAA